MRLCSALLTATLATACGEAPSPPSAAPAASPSTTAASRAAAVASAAPAPAALPRSETSGAAKPPPVDISSATPATRRARFEARRSVAPPATLPAAWQKVVKQADARITAVAHERHTAWLEAPTFDEIGVEARFFGLDAETDGRILSLLRGVGLPEVPEVLPEAPVVVGDLSWRLERHALIAPPGEPREIRYALEVIRDPPEPPNAPPCKKPKTLEPPASTPAFLAPLLRAATTRRLVAVRERRTETEDLLRAWLLFHNGDANDEMVGKLTRAAEGAGFTRQSGAEGNRQVWAGQGGERLSFKPSNEDLRLGCKVQGPLMSIELIVPSR